MTWNIRGLGKREKISIVRSLVSKHKPTLLFIQETKLSSFDCGLINSLEGYVLTRGVGVNAIGSARGLLSLWNEYLFLVKACIPNQRCIILAGELLKIRMDVAFCNVYVANVESERKELWEFISTSQNAFLMRWCIGGNFNTVLDPSERRGGESAMVSIKNFSSFVSKAKVVDIPLRGIYFTWTTYRERESRVRLDRFLISPLILSQLLNLFQIGLSGTLSSLNVMLIGEKKED
ncbi:hypothetical protein Dsin_005844 [Dipteronia sinensis]|uniref:Endonuclease/exonuclease/phosphatase domain-containing protein n=1 Tax=Dipteronia sinensis TaxID=43782 RepID=A0AAE0EFK9_9ROSI|nr:hypothetical protein Dsin_005844 [Dipteronia sinensis]